MTSRADKLAAELANDVLRLAGVDAALGSNEVRSALREDFRRRMFRAFGSCACKADELEPIFTLRAQDKLASAALLDWISLALEAGVPNDKISQALDDHQAMEDWQQEHGCKVPD